MRSCRSLWLFILPVLLVGMSLCMGQGEPVEGTIPLQAGATTDYTNPVILSANLEEYEWYNIAPASYYYKTDVVISSYHVVWLYPEIGTNDYDLFLYADSDYTDLLVASEREAGALDWVIYHYNGSTPSHYPKVYAHDGSAGTAWIEWDPDSYLDRGETAVGSFASTDFVEIYTVYLWASSSFDLQLDVPEGSDYDLYLYYVDSGRATNSSGYLTNSTTIGTGADESIIDYKPVNTGYHVVLIVRITGTGTYALFYDEHSALAVPGFTLWVSIVLTISFGAYWIKRRDRLVFAGGG